MKIGPGVSILIASAMTQHRDRRDEQRDGRTEDVDAALDPEIPAPNPTVPHADQRHAVQFIDLHAPERELEDIRHELEADIRLAAGRDDTEDAIVRLRRQGNDDFGDALVLDDLRERVALPQPLRAG